MHVEHLAGQVDRALLPTETSPLLKSCKGARKRRARLCLTIHPDILTPSPAVCP